VEAVLAARGQDGNLMRVFQRSPVPMVMIDDGRRYVEANRPARLVFRLSLAEMRGYAVDDLTPPQQLPALEAIWARLVDTGCVAGSYKVAGLDGGTFYVVYYAVANAMPGLHLGAFAPAGWPEEELSVPDTEGGAPSLPPLTPREQEVLQLAAEGLSGPDIAARLVVSRGTVKSHFGNIYEKLDVGDRAAAVAKGLRFGLID
jgi:DNA-binding CsgD family transcriptional regulator